MAPIKDDSLSDNDKSVLNAIFNPLQIGGTETSDNLDDDLVQMDDPWEANTPSVLESKKLELEAIAASEKKDYNTALALFQQAIDISPERPAPYNNRAHVYQFTSNEEAALADLNEAIKLSKGVGRTASYAFCQRGLIKLRRNDTNGARDDFDTSAKLGCSFARAKLIQMNPYAALCNQMLQDAFMKLS